jgi:hypothetical protein
MDCGQLTADNVFLAARPGCPTRLYITASVRVMRTGTLHTTQTDCAVGGSFFFEVVQFFFEPSFS